ncbi:MAG: hypothetical protein AAF567_01405 [Actinomycetota bacterium]
MTGPDPHASSEQPEPTRSFAGFRLLPFAAPRPRRGLRLLIGLWIFGAGLAMTVVADLGADPWTVFHQGVGEQIGASIGVVTIATGLAVLVVLWFMREPIGVGTIANAIVVGLAIDATIWMLPDVDDLAVRIGLLAAAPVVVGYSSAIYLGANCGPGPRDGMMTGLARRGVPTWAARTGIELSALAIGFLLGGTAGLGTIWTALAIGPCVQFFLRRVPPLPAG